MGAAVEVNLVMGGKSAEVGIKQARGTSTYIIQCLAPLNVSQLAAHQSLSKKKTGRGKYLLINNLTI